MTSKYESPFGWHVLVTGDLTIATEALDSYRETLATAEVRMQQDRDKMAQLQDSVGCSLR